MYFRQFFGTAKEGGIMNRKILFYPYGEQGYNDLHAQLHTLTGGGVSRLKNHQVVEFVDSSK